MSSQKIKVLIVDDTVMYRKILSDAVSLLPECEVVATAAQGAFALRKLSQFQVDLVLLDVFMPEMDGVETLRHIRKDYPKVSVVMVSGATTADAQITLNALNMGALDFIPKPQASSIEEGMKIISRDVEKALKLVRSRLGHTQAIPVRSASPGAGPGKPSLAPAPVPTVSSGVRPTKIDLLVIGVSTGGPNALDQVIPKLPANLGVPVLMVQHMPPMFTASLAEHLNRKSALTVREAKEGDPVKPNEVFIAPGGKHMTIRVAAGGYAIGLNESPPVHSCRPAVDVLFQSVAALFNGGVLSIILTGMGEDGAAGVAALKRKKCISIAQSEKSCVVYGMPRAVVDQGLADEVLHLQEIPGRITSIIQRGPSAR